MNKQEIEEKILEIDRLISEAKQNLKECNEILDKVKSNYKEDKWKPEYNETYYFIGSRNEVWDYTFRGEKEDKFRYDTNNMFKTEEQAEHYAELLETERQLMKYAREHNTEEIDWEDIDNKKYFLMYGVEEEKVEIEKYGYYKFARTVYFTSKEIAENAVKEIGEDKVKAYLKEL